MPTTVMTATEVKMMMADQNYHMNKLAEQIEELDQAYTRDMEALIEQVQALQDEVKRLKGNHGLKT